MSASQPGKPVPRSIRSLSPSRRILPAAVKPTHVTKAEIRRLIREAEKTLGDAGEA